MKTSDYNYYQNPFCVELRENGKVRYLSKSWQHVVSDKTTSEYDTAL